MTDQEARAHIDNAFRIAKARDADIHMLVDDTDDPNSRSLEYLAVKTLRGIGTLALGADERVRDVRFSEDSLIVDLKDGRTISVPLEWDPRLAVATPQQRENWEVCAASYGIHWPDLDEDLNTEGLLRGAPAPRPRTEHLTKRFSRRRRKTRRG